MATKITEFRKTAKAWVGAAVAALTGLSAVLVPDSTVGVLVASALGFLVALGAVFNTSNKDDAPQLNKGVDPRF